MGAKTLAAASSNPLLIVVSVIIASIASLPAVINTTAQAAGPQIRVLSNRPDMVSGGDVLIRIDVSPGAMPRDVSVTLNGSDVTSRFRVDEAGRSLTGLVTGLAVGANTVAAIAGKSPAAQVTVTNHPAWGPVFSGPHEKPFICQTQDFKLRSGGTLGPPLDAQLLDRDARGLPLSLHGWRRAQAACPIRQTASRSRDGHDVARPQRALRRPHRDRHDQPGDLSDRDAPRSGSRAGCRIHDSRRPAGTAG